MATSKIGPAGSLEPINTEKGKWTDNLGALEISTLAALATDINKTVDQTIKHVARGKIKVGKLLLEARRQFQNDANFGKWRVDNTMVQSKQHAHYLMQVAEQFGNATVLIEGANYSVMQELVTADQKEIQWVVDKVEKGEPPTVQEVREKVKESKGTSKKGSVNGPGVGTLVIPNAHINKVVQMTLTRRIQEVVERGIKGIEGDLVILGMDPDPQTPTHRETLNAIRDYWQEEVQNGDELAAVRDSYNRVVEEFEDWDRN